MDEQTKNSPKRSRSLREVLQILREYYRIANIVVKMSEEERCDFFDWWNHSRHQATDRFAIARREFRDLARKVGVL